jgi:RimJ/RimL family protein N-acetyltransferase
MPLEGIVQPNIIQVNDYVRLRKSSADEYHIAVPWYRDYEVYYNSEGVTEAKDIPDEEYVRGMYKCLENAGENYFIEVLEDGVYIPVGDVVLMPKNPCIAIGVERYRSAGIGTKVMAALVERAKSLGIPKLYDTMVYDYNIRSQRMFESLGFKRVRQDGRELFYELDLNTAPLI